MDQTYGHWNAPVDPQSGEFVYVPIPERRDTPFKPGLQRSYLEVLPVLEDFAARFKLDLEADLGFPRDLLGRSMHLDPDFEWLTYGDNGKERGAEIKRLREDDLLVFYAGLQSVRASQKLIYALVGLFVVNEVVLGKRVPVERHKENAHTRKLRIGAPDIVVRAKPGVSGRLTRCIPIGEWREGAYRVTRQLLREWGGLSVRDGFIQRSVRPPSFCDGQQFHNWLEKHDVRLIQRNN